MFIPPGKLCILFCNQLAFNLFGTLSPPSISTQVSYRCSSASCQAWGFTARGPLSGLAPSGYLQMWAQGADKSTAHKIRQSTKPCRDMPALRWCCKPREITDVQIRDIKHAMGWGSGGGGWCYWEAGKNETEMVRFEHYLCFGSNWGKKKMLPLNALFKKTPNLELKRKILGRQNTGR